MLRSAKVAIPAATAIVVVPASVPDPGFVAIAIVTLPANPVARFPNASCTATTTAGVIALPALMLVG